MGESMDKIRRILLDNSIFRRTYIICLFLCNVSFVQIPMYVLLVFLFLWGSFLVFYNERVKHTFLKMRFGIWLFTYLLLTTITAVIHITDNFLYNIVMQLHVAICFFIFYAVHTEKRLNFRRELYSVCQFIVYSTTVIGIIGLSFMMAGISFEFLWIKFIIYENRFTGLYTNPNILGFVSVVAIFCCHMLIKKDFISLSGKERISRIWIGTCLAVNSISLLLCDSKAALVLMISYAMVFIIYKMFGAENKFSVKQIIMKVFASILAGAFLVTSLFFVRYICQTGFSDVINAVDKMSVQNLEEIPEDEVDEIFNATSRITFSHENTSFDSGRIKLLKQAAQMFKLSPIFGIGKGNVYEYGEKNLEDGVSFSDLYGDWLANYVTDFHNGYATILVCSGLFGFGIFAVFGVRFAKHISVYVFTDSKLSESILPCMYSFLCAYLVYALFEKALLYDISFMVVFFWMIMGYVSSFLCKYEPVNQGEFYIFNKRLRRTII